MFYRPKTDRNPDSKPLEITRLNNSCKDETIKPKTTTPERVLTPELEKEYSPEQIQKPRKPRFKKTTAAQEGRDVRSRALKPMTKTRIKNITEYYLTQRDASGGMIRQMLHRRAYAWLNSLEEEHRHTTEEDFNTDVEAIIAELQSTGHIDDARFAKMKAYSWRSAGKGIFKIQTELSKKGISDSIIQEAISEADAELIDTDNMDDDIAASESERASAERLAQKKRIGPFRTKERPGDTQGQVKLWRREAGVLSRAGYNLDIIKEILDRAPNLDDDPDWP